MHPGTLKVMKIKALGAAFFIVLDDGLALAGGGGSGAFFGFALGLALQLLLALLLAGALFHALGE
jgi:hypothetical protein